MGHQLTYRQPSPKMGGTIQTTSGVLTMLVLPELENRSTESDRSFSTLTRTLTLSRGCFCLLLVNCNCSETQERAIQKLSKTYNIQKLVIPKSAKTLYNLIQAKVAARGELNKISPLSALCICGLDSVRSLDELLQDTNFMRDRFSASFSFPLIFWVTDEVHKKLIRLAPDFENIATSGISFVPGP